MRLKKVSEAHRYYDGVHSYLEKFNLIQSGEVCYTVEYVRKVFPGDITLKTFNIYPRGDFYPEILYLDGFLERERCFKIQTVARGALDLDTYADYLDGVQIGWYAARVLTAHFIDKKGGICDDE